jgi:hypothetical protein
VKKTSQHYQVHEKEIQCSNSGATTHFPTSGNTPPHMTTPAEAGVWTAGAFREGYWAGGLARQ